jgi:hypothetical protein
MHKVGQPTTIRKSKVKIEIREKNWEKKPRLMELG